MALYSSAATINKYLSEMIRSGSPIDCSKAYGGAIGLNKGEITWKAGQGVRLSSAQAIFGQGPATRITYLGGPKDPPAIEIYSYTGNGYVDSPLITGTLPGWPGFQLHCPNGGRAIAVHESVKALEAPTINVVTNGAIELNVEQYDTQISGRLINAPLNIKGGSCNKLNRLKVQGNSTVTIGGACDILGFSWFEDAVNGQPTAPKFRFTGWVDNDGNRHRGSITIAGQMHDEAHHFRPWGVVEDSDLYATRIGGTESWNWDAIKTGTINLIRPPHNVATIRSSDGTGKLFVGSVEKQIIAEAQK